jgi:hypothetical protein
MACVKTFIALITLVQIGLIGWSCHSISIGTNHRGLHIACLAVNLFFSAINVKNLMRPQQDWIPPQES